MVNVFTTIGVVAALILTMEKTGEAIDGEDVHASEWIDCSEFPCNTIHVTLSWFSLIGCAHAVMYTTCAIVWLSLTPAEATRDFFYWTPSIMQRPSQSMMLGVTCWSFDALWLTAIKHGSNLMIWLSFPAVFLLLHAPGVC
ncbi:unnamed protein product [Symbiodinium pilosum]|uniref:Uncharacterized protein n=1 Tax=Symbiodinium pilosum TaxID=2952 RepID=A0A812L4R8_SYMPI|nr:unnamed protein product [Symbiodinium pilosum]